MNKIMLNERKQRLVEKAKAGGLENPLVEILNYDREIGVSVILDGRMYSVFIFMSDDEEKDTGDLISSLLVIARFVQGGGCVVVKDAMIAPDDIAWRVRGRDDREWRVLEREDDRDE